MRIDQKKYARAIQVGNDWIVRAGVLGKGRTLWDTSIDPGPEDEREVRMFEALHVWGYTLLWPEDTKRS